MMDVQYSNKGHNAEDEKTTLKIDVYLHSDSHEMYVPGVRMIKSFDGCPIFSGYDGTPVPILNPKELEKKGFKRTMVERSVLQELADVAAVNTKSQKNHHIPGHLLDVLKKAA